MKKRKKKLLLILLAILAVAASSIATIMLITPKKEYVQIVRENDNAMIAYMKHEQREEENTVYSLNLCQIDSTPMVICQSVSGFEVEENNGMIAYALDDDDYYRAEVHLINGAGVKQLLSKNVSVYEMSRYGSTIAYLIRDEEDKLFIREYNLEGDVENRIMVNTDVSSMSWNINRNGEIIVFTQNKRTDQEEFEGENVRYEFDWADIVVYYNGQVEKIAEKAFLSAVGQSISNDGSVLYMADGNEETKTGTLYLKEIGKEPIVITENVQFRFGISDNSELIYARIDNNGEDALFYQFSGQEAVIVDNILMGLMSQNSNTLVYLTKTDDIWSNVLYWVDDSSEPKILSDNVSFLFEISDDGKSVAYIANFSEEKQTGDLYIAREGEGIELIDTGVTISRWANFFGESTVNLSNDGNTIAYLKNFDGDRLWGDLYMKQKGEEPQRIDEKVSIGFDFFG